jgi:hypothetical protein
VDKVFWQICRSVGLQSGWVHLIGTSGTLVGGDYVSHPTKEFFELSAYHIIALIVPQPQVIVQQRNHPSVSCQVSLTFGFQNCKLSICIMSSVTDFWFSKLQTNSH